MQILRREILTESQDGCTVKRKVSRINDLKQAERAGQEAGYGRRIGRKRKNDGIPCGRG